MRQLQALAAWENEDETLYEPEPPVPFEFKFFQPPLLPKRRYWRSFLLSATLHCTVIFGLPRLMDFLPESDAEAFQRQMLAMRPLEIRVPDRLYVSPTAPKEEPPPPQAAKPKQQPKPVELAKEQLAELSKPLLEAPRVAPKQFRPPPSIPKTDNDLTLVQSHLPPQLPLTAQVKLPQLVLSGPVLPRPAPRRFVEPGKSADPAVVPRLDAPPMLSSPSDSNPDLRIESMLAGPDFARLRLPRPNVPARKFQAPAPVPSGRGASVSPTLGEPINILALSSDPVPMEGKIVVPLGNQIGRLPDYKETAPAGTPTKGAGKEAADAAAGAASGAGSNKAGTGKAGGWQAEVDEFVKALASLPERYATPIKMEHPTNTAFDVVVVQSSPEQAFPDSVGVLSGKPVYTVYLQVGAPKAWILQYCIPKQVEAAPQIVGGAVNIGNPSPLKAPYPLVTVLPPATMLPRTGYIIVRALLDIKGQIKDAAVVRAPNPRVKDSIIAELLKWQFRPAVKDGGPVVVEILLAIPPQDV